MKVKLNGNRTLAALQFLAMLTLFPACFVGLRAVTAGALSAVTVDDSICAWVDGVIGLSPPASSHRWLIELLTLLLGVAAGKFITSAVREVRYTHNVEPVEVLEVLARTVSIFFLSLALNPAFTVLFCRVLKRLGFSQFVVILIAIPLTLWLCWHNWRYPNRRLKLVQRKYHFERIKKL